MSLPMVKTLTSTRLTAELPRQDEFLCRTGGYKGNFPMVSLFIKYDIVVDPNLNPASAFKIIQMSAQVKKAPSSDWEKKTVQVLGWKIIRER